MSTLIPGRPRHGLQRAVGDPVLDLVVSSQVPGDPDEGHRIGAVVGDGEVEYDVGKLDQLDEWSPGPARRPGRGSRVVLTQAGLTLGADHPVRLHPLMVRRPISKSPGSIAPGCATAT